MQAVQASFDADFEMEARALWTLAQIPRKVLLLPSRRGIGFARQALASMRATEVPPMPQTDSSHAEAPVDHIPEHHQPDPSLEDDAILPESTAPASDATSRLVKRAISLLRRGHLGRAAKALFQSSPPRCDDAAIEKLRSFHPSRPTVIPAPPIPLPPPTLVDSQKLHSVLKRSATGASPGPSGWTAEHLLLLFQDKPCAEAITAITSDICNGFLPHAARDWLVGSRLIAIPKDDTGVRPISIGEALYRLASAYLSDLVTPHMPDIFSSLQKGVGVSGGADRALHATQLSLELLRAKCDPVVLAIDIKNAFNTIDRGAVARALIQQPHLHPLWRFFEWSYAHRSNLMVFDNEGSLTAHIESV